MKTRITLLLIITITLSLRNAIYPQDKIVEGATEFLIERANDNFVYIFEQKIIADSILFGNYFKRTYDFIYSIDIRTLLTNNRVWRECVTADIDTLYTQVWKSLGKGFDIFPEDKLGTMDRFLTSLQNAKLYYNGKYYPLNSIELSDPQEVKNIVNNISNTYIGILDLLVRIKPYFAAKKVESFIEGLQGYLKSNKANISDVEDINQLLELINNFNDILNAKDYNITNKENLLQDINKIKPFLEDASDIIASSRILIDTSYSFTYRVINSFIIVNYLIKRSEELTGVSFNQVDYNKYFDKFKQYVVFFAQLSDAESVDQVKNILKAATIPSVSYDLKRREIEYHFTISSYLGLSIGIESINGFKQGSFFGGLSTPIGLEFSYGTSNKNSFGVLFSIFDFGPAVNSKLYNSDIKYQLVDLIQPGVYLVYGIKELPLAVTLGYYAGKGYKIDSPNVNHFNISVLFDMPLFLIF